LNHTSKPRRHKRIQPPEERAAVNAAGDLRTRIPIPIDEDTAFFDRLCDEDHDFYAERGREYCGNGFSGTTKPEGASAGDIEGQGEEEVDIDDG
jgi:hypothetical protein